MRDLLLYLPVGNFYAINGDSSLRGFVKWTGGAFGDICQGPVGREIGISSESLLSLYPNPTNNAFSFNGLLESEKYPIRIFDFSGKVVLEKVIFGKESIPISNLNSGMYCVEIISGEKRELLKLLKN